MSSNTVEIHNSAVIRAYPWLNGVVLAHKKKEYLVTRLKDLNCSAPLQELALSLAAQVDDLQTLNLDDKSTREFVQRFLGCGDTDISVTDKRTSLVQLSASRNSSYQHIITAAHVVFRYQLLDILAYVLDVPNHEKWSPVYKSAFPTRKGGRIGNIIDSLKDWPVIISKFQRIYKAKIDCMDVDHDFASIDGDTNSPDKVLFKSGIRCLSSALRYRSDEKFTKVMYHIHILVFCVWWLGAVCLLYLDKCIYHNAHESHDDQGFTQFPQDETMLSQVLASRAKDIGLQLTDQYLTNIVGELKSMTKVMRNIFYIALSISPILVLQPKKFDDDAIRRDQLIAHAVCLGNQKPKRLQDTEKALWKMVFNIAVGGDDTKEIETFVQVINGLDNSPMEDTVADWFIQGPEPVPPIFPGAKDADSPVQPASSSEVTPPPNDMKARLRKKNSKLAIEVSDEASITNKTPRITEVSVSKPKNNRDGENEARIHPEPDLPMPLVEDADESIPEYSETENGKPDAESIHVKLFYADRMSNPMDYEFKVSRSTSKVEYALLTDIQKSVQRLFRNGRPPHHHESSSNPELEEDGSEIFVTTPEVFEMMSPEAVQRIFRHRHILVRGSQPRSLKFDKAGLETLGSLKTPRQVQVGSLRTIKDPSAMLRTATLEHLLPRGSDSANPPVLNILDLPMGGASIPTPPQYQSLATNKKAFQVTRGLPGMTNEHFPHDAMLWGTAATRNATSWQHIDDHGLATIIKVMAGLKYWVVARQKRDQQKGPGYNGDMGSINAYGKGWIPSMACGEIWDHEGVLLRPGDILYMKPNTMHYVLTVEDSITYGRHLYPTSTILNSVFGIVHTFIMNYGVTNAQHDNLGTMLRRMMTFWQMEYAVMPPGEVTQNAHIPDISTAEGLLDVIAVGNLLELSQVLDRRSYAQGIPMEEQLEMAASRWRFRAMITQFARDFVTTLNGKFISPHNICRRSLVEFAAALVVYKRKRCAQVPTILGCTPKSVYTKVLAFFMANYPELTPCLENMVNGNRTLCFYWTGPQITIKRKAGRCLNDFEDCPIYVSNMGPEDNKINKAQLREMHNAPSNDIPKRSSKRVRVL